MCVVPPSSTVSTNDSPGPFFDHVQWLPQLRQQVLAPRAARHLRLGGLMGSCHSPRYLALADSVQVHQQVLLIFGQIGEISTRPLDGSLTDFHPRAGQSTTRTSRLWSISSLGGIAYASTLPHPRCLPAIPRYPHMLPL
jgi:hypothetical protein